MGSGSVNRWGRVRRNECLGMQERGRESGSAGAQRLNVEITVNTSTPTSSRKGCSGGRPLQLELRPCSARSCTAGLCSARSCTAGLWQRQTKLRHWLSPGNAGIRSRPLCTQKLRGQTRPLSRRTRALSARVQSSPACARGSLAPMSTGKDRQPRREWPPKLELLGRMGTGWARRARICRLESPPKHRTCLG
jgi:hypothetical protein